MNAIPSQPMRSALCAVLQVALLTTLLSACAGAAARDASTLHAAPDEDPLANVEAAQLFHDGEALAARGDLVRAEQYLAAAIRHGYPQERVLPVLLRVCLSSSRLGAALQHATPYLRLHPSDYRLRWVVASVLIGLGRYDQARVELLRVLTNAPEHAEAHYLLGLLLRDHYNDDDAAAPHFEAHLRLAADGLHGAEVAAWLRERLQLAQAEAVRESEEEATP